MLLIPLATHGQATTNIEQRMRTIIIPSLDIRQANAIEVLTFLVDAASAIKPANSSIGLINTNKPSTKEHSTYTYQLDDGTPLELPPITLTHTRITMYDAATLICKEVGLTFRAENGSINFFTLDGKRIIRKKHVEQAVPAYPPQGVGSAEP